MSDIIQLLSDAVANQIAAGEVIQRPGSIVKELVENAVDAGATNIQVIVKDAGRTLVQVIDNGCGMSATDARMAFERHATSKIKEANDLFAIRTMGFRGEALASIAAVSHTELRTKREDDVLGSQICIAGSKVESQEPISCPSGSNFSIKNLFYNIPARRKFLKKDATELRHIINEFQRIALANVDVAFSLVHNDMPLLILPVSNIRQRIVKMVGKSINAQLIPIEISTSIVKMSGFIGKPESARKTFGDQFFFVNQRYMKHSYLHRAIIDAYQSLIQTGYVPAYFLYFEIDPKTIDINIHPTKTEIKFEDERALWQILNASVRESLGKFNLVPSIDFDTTDKIDIPYTTPSENISAPKITVNPNYNPFESEDKSSATSSNKPNENAITNNWEQLYSGFESEKGTSSYHENSFVDDNTWSLPKQEQAVQQTFVSAGMNNNDTPVKTSFFQFKNRYILTSGTSGLMIIDQKRAHERIIYERLIASIQTQKTITQQNLFPENLEFNAEDTHIIEELIEDLKMFGLDIESTQKNIFTIKGTPADLDNCNPKYLIDGILDSYKSGEIDIKQDVKERLAQSLAKQSAIPSGKALSNQEMDELIGQLFVCQVPNYTADGKAIISILSNDEIENRMK